MESIFHRLSNHRQGASCWEYDGAKSKDSPGGERCSGKLRFSFKHNRRFWEQQLFLSLGFLLLPSLLIFSSAAAVRAPFLPTYASRGPFTSWRMRNEATRDCIDYRPTGFSSVLLTNRRNCTTNHTEPKDLCKIRRWFYILRFYRIFYCFSSATVSFQRRSKDFRRKIALRYLRDSRRW